MGHLRVLVEEEVESGVLGDEQFSTRLPDMSPEIPADGLLQVSAAES